MGLRPGPPPQANVKTIDLIKAASISVLGLK
jgi:hypothetical protein